MSPTFANFCTRLAGVSIAEIARRFGTPTFVYDAAKIAERVADLKAFDVVRYAQKACSNIAILDWIRRHGAVVDAVSAGEIHRALAAGYGVEGDPAPIVYTADLFDAEALKLCVEKNVPVNCGSLDMIAQLGQRAPGREIILRINPGFGHGHSQKTNTGGDQSKHGIWFAQLPDALALAARFGSKVTGLHMHIGSGTDLEHLSQVCGAMEKAAVAVGPTVRTISCGGGLPVPYREDQSYVDLDAYFKLWDVVRKRLASAFGHPVRLEIEPGRYLVAESGSLIAEIRAVKRQAENVFYLLDAGFNNLARPILYGSHHPMAVATADERRAGPDQEVIVGGPLCESGDIFTQEEGGFVAKRLLPQANVGDFVVLGVTGAYGFMMGSNYNSKPLAAEVMLRDGTAHLIRRRQSFEDLMRGEEKLP